MKKIFCFSLFIFILTTAFAEKNFEINSIVSKIKSPTIPYVDGNYMVFTAEENYRHVGIAFEFEDFKTIHSFQRLITYDIDNEPEKSILFYILELPENLKTIKYKMIIDGLWVLDPNNPDKYYNHQTNITLSQCKVNKEFPLKTNISAEKKVSFYYEGTSGEKIRLGGNFTNWDSYIYQLEEVSPGIYKLELPLPPGKYYYNFYNGFEALIDKKNPLRAYTKDGRIASVLEVK